MEFIVKYFENLLALFIDMSFYIVLGLFTVGILNAFVNKKWLTKQIGDESIWSVIKASVIGVPLPLCSCGVVPMSMELKKSGGSNGAVVSFLTSTPQTGVDSMIATYGMLGGFMAFFRAIAAFISGIVSGVIVNIFGKNEALKEVQSSCCGSKKEEKTSCCSEKAEPVSTCCSSEKEEKISCCSEKKEAEKVGLIEKIKTIFTYGFGSFLDEIADRFIVGLLISALISTAIPDDFFMKFGLDNMFLSMMLMIVIGLPMYICSTSSIPIVVSMIAKGLSAGAGFVFLFVGPVTNMASLIMIEKALGKKITALYVGNAILMSMLFGYLLNLFVNLDLYVFSSIAHTHHMSHGNMFSGVIAIIFAGLLVKSLVIKYAKK